MWQSKLDGQTVEWWKAISNLHPKKRREKTLFSDCLIADWLESAKLSVNWLFESVEKRAKRVLRASPSARPPSRQHAFAIKISMFTRTFSVEFFIAFAYFSQSFCGLRIFPSLRGFFAEMRGEEKKSCRFAVLIIRMFNFLFHLPTSSFSASSRFSHVRLTSFTSIRRRNEHGSPPQRKPSVLVSSTTRRATCTELLAWRERKWALVTAYIMRWDLINNFNWRLLSTPPSHPTWHSHKRRRSSGSGAMCEPTPFMVSANWKSPKNSPNRFNPIRFGLCERSRVGEVYREVSWGEGSHQECDGKGQHERKLSCDSGNVG